MSKGNFQKFLSDLGQRESENQYHRVNTLGFTGKYQFGEAILIDIGYYRAAPGTFYCPGSPSGTTDMCLWNGVWTKKANECGVFEYAHFRANNGNIQEKAIVDAFRFNINTIRSELQIKGHTLEGCLSRTGNTYSGILAAAHLAGAYGAVDFLMYGWNRRDEYKTPMSVYAEEFKEYQVNDSDIAKKVQ